MSSNALFASQFCMKNDKLESGDLETGLGEEDSVAGRAAAQVWVLLQVVEEGRAHHVGEGALARGQGIGEVLPGALVDIAADHYKVGVEAAGQVLQHRSPQASQAVVIAISRCDLQGGGHTQDAEEGGAVQMD